MADKAPTQFTEVGTDYCTAHAGIRNGEGQ